jgi:hypothetical protein
MTDWMRKLKNRPIPDAYQSAGTTPLMVDVKPEQKTYELTMRRRPS